MARRSILLIVAVIVAALGTTMIVLYVQGIDARAAQGQELVEVLTATEVIDAGETVAAAQEAGKLEKTEVVREDMVEGALTSTTSIEDQVALGTIYPGEQIIADKFGAGRHRDPDHPGRQARHQRRAHRLRAGRRLRQPRLRGRHLRLGPTLPADSPTAPSRSCRRHPAAAAGSRSSGSGPRR